MSVTLLWLEGCRRYISTLFGRCQMVIGYPAYLKSLVSTFRFITANKSVSSLVNMTAYDSAWPEASKLGLNASQYLAFKSALTQEISVIQGLFVNAP